MIRKRDFGGKGHSFLSPGAEFLVGKLLAAEDDVRPYGARRDIFSRSQVALGNVVAIEVVLPLYCRIACSLTIFSVPAKFNFAS